MTSAGLFVSYRFLSSFSEVGTLDELKGCTGREVVCGVASLR